MRRWTKIVLSILLLCLLVCLVLLVSPLVQPLLAHPSANTLLHELLTSHASGPLVAGPFPWLLLGLMGSIVLVVGIDNTLRKRVTHGSAGYASRRQLRPYRVPRQFRLP